MDRVKKGTKECKVSIEEEVVKLSTLVKDLEGESITKNEFVKAAKDKRSYVAFEARIRDAENAEVLVMSADREAEKAAPMSFNDTTWYGHAHNIIDDWSEQFVKVANRDREAGEVVEDSKAVTLKHW